MSVSPSIAKTLRRLSEIDLDGDTDQTVGSPPVDVNEQFAVMFDAGSTGTRVKVYKYIKKGDLAVQLKDFQELAVPKPNKVKPGLSSFSNNIKGNEIMTTREANTVCGKKCQSFLQFKADMTQLG